MKHPNEFTEAELDALDLQALRPNRRAREDLSSRLQAQLNRLLEEMRKTGESTKALSAESKPTPDALVALERTAELTLKIQSKLQRLQNLQTGITRITIENFKGIGAPVTIPLRPITLLFGANSAGKSTIIQALHYARELLERNNANPDHTLLGGEAIELGGFSNLVHRHKLGRDIRLRIDITPTADGVPTLQDILGTADQEEMVGVNPDEIRRLLSELSRKSSSRSGEQEHLCRNLQRRLEDLWSEIFQKDAEHSQAVFRERLSRVLQRLQQLQDGRTSQAPLPQSFLALKDFLMRSLEASGSEREVKLEAHVIRRHLDALSADVRSCVEQLGRNDQLSQALRLELENLRLAASAEDSGRAKLEYWAKLEAEFQLLMERLSISSRTETDSSLWQKLSERLLGSVESSRGLNINPHVIVVSIELVSRWDPDQQIGWFAECHYWVNGQSIISICKAKPDSRPAIEYIEFFHPVLLAMDENLTRDCDRYNEELAELMAQLEDSLMESLLKNLRLETLGFDVVRPSTGEVLIGQSQPLADKLLHRLVQLLPDVECRATATEAVTPARVHIETAVKSFERRQVQLKKGFGFYPMIQLGQGKECSSVAPSPDKPLPFPPAALGEGKEQYFNLINQIVVGITALARDLLENFRYIGPIRAIPDRHHEAPQVQEPARWASGLGAWDLLLRHYDRARGKGDEFVEQVSRWFEDKDRLGLGYRIEVTGLRSLAEDSLLMSQLKALQSQYDEHSPQEFGKNILQPLQSAPQSPRIRIVDTRNGTPVGPKDIGIGVAQALPIVVGALDSKCPFLAIEQPELHLHPAAQARLGDLFVTQAKKDRLFLIETHSETLMLRIFRRIRETKRNKLPRPDLEMERENIALLYVSIGESGTSISQIRLDDQGKFVDPVPGGFFEEGFDELF